MTLVVKRLFFPLRAGLARLAPFACLLLILLTAACGNDPERDYAVLEGRTMGTFYTITLVADEGEKLPIDRTELQTAVDEELQKINQMMSTYIDDSELMRLSRAPIGQWQPVSEPLMEVFRISRQVSEKSDGAFDITVGPLVNLWGFGPDGQPEQVPDKSVIEDTLARVGYEKLELKDQKARRLADIQLDLSGVAKGYGIDWLTAFLLERGFDNVLVEIGGDIRVHGESPRGDAWRLAIEQPAMLRSNVRQVVPVRDRAMVTSGEYRNFYEVNGQRYSHSIDPDTGYPVRHQLVSVTVIDDNAAEADAWATAISALGEERGMELAERERLPVYMILTEDKGFSDRHSSAFEPYLERTNHE